MVKVTREQMNAVRRQMGKINMSLNILIGYARVGEFSGESSPINHMSVEQIVLAWHGYVEVEPELVSFNIAKKALLEGKKVFWYFTSGISGRANLMLSDSLDIYGELTFEDLFNGKFTIEGDNR